MSGIIQTGENGFSSELVNTDTGFVSHHRTVVEAEFIPFFFMAACPVGEDFGVLLLQRFKNFGVKDFFVNPLIESFQSEHGSKGVRLRITRLVPRDLAQQLLNDSIVKSIRLIRYEDPGEVSDALGQGYAEQTGAVEMVFKAKRDSSLPAISRLIDAMQGKKPINQVYSLDNFEYDSIKVDIEVNGKKRVIDIGKPSVVSPNVDVTENVNIDATGQPTWDSLTECFCTFAQDTMASEEIAWTLDGEAATDVVAPALAEELTVPG